MKAIEELKNEHHGIEIMLRILQAVADRFGRGQEVDGKDLSNILEFLSVFVDKCHHAKEEEFLFPALENVGVLREGGPIGVMLLEHEQGRRLVAMLKDALAGHESGLVLRKEQAQTIIKEYVALLDEHITKENTVLFPMAEAKLDPDKDKELFEAFEQLERERIGEGKHSEFHALLHRLQATFVVGVGPR
ncbi:Hemerythrin HHE cation binding domain protein [uncultured Desulfatiglans sp.]|nr:Hemerythrin HHE cation binding domain protein [uncultured Desulfatiglans sp.]